MEKEKGKTFVTVVGGWMILKGIINLLISFNMGNIISLLVSVALAALMVVGIKYSNYIVAVILALIVIKNLGYNISTGALLYLAEAVVDVFCVIGLVASKEVKEYLS